MFLLKFYHAEEMSIVDVEDCSDSCPVHQPMRIDHHTSCLYDHFGIVHCEIDNHRREARARIDGLTCLGLSGGLPGAVETVVSEQPQRLSLAFTKMSLSMRAREGKESNLDSSDINRIPGMA